MFSGDFLTSVCMHEVIIHVSVCTVYVIVHVNQKIFFCKNLAIFPDCTMDLMSMLVANFGQKIIYVLRTPCERAHC